MAVEVLLVEDSPGDVRLTREAFREVNMFVLLNVASDGVEAMKFLAQEGPYTETPRPEFILLDLNLPRMDGREVLRRIKADPALKMIPTVVLSTSDSDDDVANCYALGVNCYLIKPVDLEEFTNLVKTINEFWLTRVKIPKAVLAG